MFEWSATLHFLISGSYCQASSLGMRMGGGTTPAAAHPHIHYGRSKPGGRPHRRGLQLRVTRHHDKGEARGAGIGCEKGRNENSQKTDFLLNTKLQFCLLYMTIRF